MEPDEDLLLKPEEGIQFWERAWWSMGSLHTITGVWSPSLLKASSRAVSSLLLWSRGDLDLGIRSWSCQFSGGLWASDSSCLILVVSSDMEPTLETNKSESQIKRAVQTDLNSPCHLFLDFQNAGD